MSNANMKLWDQYEATDPQYTRELTIPYKHTDINATYFFKRATEAFGPCGVGWGYTASDPDYQSFDTGELLIRVRIVIWYRHDGAVVHGPIVDGCKMLRAKTKNGLQIDDEAYKKAVADGLKKGLSMLGFCADVFLGHFDEPRERRRDRNPAPARTADQPPEPATEAAGASGEGEDWRERAVGVGKKKEVKWKDAPAYTLEWLRDSYEARNPAQEQLKRYAKMELEYRSTHSSQAQAQAADSDLKF